jgi:hypothetical protein
MARQKKRGGGGVSRGEAGARSRGPKGLGETKWLALMSRKSICACCEGQQLDWPKRRCHWCCGPLVLGRILWRWKPPWWVMYIQVQVGLLRRNRGTRQMPACDGECTRWLHDQPPCIQNFNPAIRGPMARRKAISCPSHTAA